jgi:DNA-binding NtrC family response regulator
MNRIRGTEEEIAGIFNLFIDYHCRREPLILKDLMKEVEIGVIRNVLHKGGGNIKCAAMVLNAKYSTLCEKIRRHDIPR